MSNFIILTILLLLIPFTTADIRNIKITSDSRSDILLGKFRFTESGHLSVSIESATFTSMDNLTRLAFCIFADRDVYHTKCPLDKPPVCLLDREKVQILVNFTKLLPPQNSFQKLYPIKLPNTYSLYFANCQPDSPITMRVTTEMYNLNNGGYKSYLPAGQTQFPILYLVFAATYLVFFLVWVDISIANKKTHFGNYLLMGGLVLMKALSLICAAVDKRVVNLTGTSHGWDVVLCIVEMIRVILLCTVIYSFGVNWSILAPRGMQTFMMKVLMISLLLQLILDVVQIQILENRPFIKNWVDLNIYLLINQIVPYEVTGIGFGSAYNSLFVFRDIEGTTGRKLVKFNIFKFFLAMVFVFAMLISAMGYCWKIDMGEHQWVGYVVDEIATLVIYTSMFYVFHVAIQKDLFFVFNIIADVVDEVAV